MELKSFRGEEILPWLDALGMLRITVFRAYPYLYEGTLEYERDYLRTYAAAERALVTLALDGERAVGATTCVPLVDEGPEFQEPFLRRGINPASVCYFGESILLPEYRGLGLGRAFFDVREAHARALPGVVTTAFCAVDRPPDHPMRPPGYRELDGFWLSLGYRKRPGMQSRFRWREVGETEESEKTLTFWTREWTTA
jgi:GNAT superfamily N-acetyltransferase